jgi:hypothetical protein
MCMAYLAIQERPKHKIFLIEHYIHSLKPFVYDVIEYDYLVSIVHKEIMIGNN